MRRFKEKDLSDRRNTVPEHQEILTDIRFIVWIDSLGEEVKTTLATRIEQAKTNPSSVKRFGCLYLGESSDLVNSVRLASEKYLKRDKRWLVKDDRGNMTLPYWVDHVGSRGTRWLRYSLIEIDVDYPPLSSWTVIQTD